MLRDDGVGDATAQETAGRRVAQRARQAVLRLPPLARRDERIAELRLGTQDLRRQLTKARRDRDHLRAELRHHRRESESELAVARAEAHREREAAQARLESVRVDAETAVDVAVAATRLGPSFGAHLHADRRTFNAARRTVAGTRGRTDAPRVELMRKLTAYRFAESHGVAVPTVYSVWSDLDEIDWASLPEAFVLKSVRGFSSHGVFPLRRVPGGFQVVGEPKLWTPADLTTALRRRQERGHIDGPYFAEELLTERTEPGALPTDHKLYAFYGQVGHVLLRRMTQHGNIRTAHWQYLDRDGVDLGDVAHGRPVNPDLPAPANLPEFVEIAERLSLAVPTPMVRVDLYDTNKGVCLGEFTVLPGGKQQYRDDHEAVLGLLWEEAAGRLQRDLANGRPYALIRGDHPVRTPAEPTERMLAPNPFAIEPLVTDPDADPRLPAPQRAAVNARP